MSFDIDAPLLPRKEEEGEAVEVTVEAELPEDSVVIDFGEPESEEIIPFEDNLAEYMEKEDKASLASEVIDYALSDKRARKEWETALTKGMDYLGLKIEERTQPWAGASGVFHPMLTEAVISFQSQAMSELWPAAGPVKAKLVGKVNTELQKQALRVQEDMNYVATVEMRDYRPETERLLFNLPLMGSAFRKLYFDPVLNVPRAAFVSAQDFLAPYGATDLFTCDRYTHVMMKTEHELDQLQRAGFYLDIDIGDPAPVSDDFKEKIDSLMGETPQIEHDDRHTILECHMYCEILDEEPSPYVVSVHRDSGEILSVYRNWSEDDERRTKRLWFAHHQYIPGMGFYGIGLIHLLGGLTRSATSIMRQLIDSGTLSNLPAGLKARGLRIKGDNTPLMPGEFRDVDIPGGAIKDNITFLPYKEPSVVLYQLLQNVVDEGRRIGSMADLKASDMNNQAPVGSTLAVIERSMKVITAVQARLHASMKTEFEILASIVRDFMPSEYPYEVDEEATRAKDYDNRVDVLPVSNPNASTMAQRIMQGQAALQLSSTAPELYDRRKMHTRMMYALGIEDTDELLPDRKDIKAMDPITENMNLIKGEPIKVVQYQDHEAHIQAHMAAMEDPKLIALLGQSPQAKAVFGAATAHIQEHLAHQYRVEIERQLGFELPPLEETLPPEVEREISQLAAQAADKLLGKSKAEEEQKRIQEQMQDPIIQIRLKEMELKEKDLQRKAASDQARIEQQEKDRASEERVEGAKIGARVVEASIERSQSEEDRTTQEKLKGAELGVDLVKEAARQLSVKKEQTENT